MTKVTPIAIVIFLLASTFYLYEFSLQVSPAVMTTHLMADFQITAVGVGAISAAYFYAYAPMQLPAGLLYDRYGPRVLLTIATLVCAIGALVFALTDSTFIASMGRFLMGLGSAFAFVGVLILVAYWFPPHYFALMAGIAQFMSSLGAIGGEVPMALLIESTGWRGAMFWMTGIGLILAIVIWKVVRDAPNHQIIETQQQTQSISEFTRLKAVCTNLQTWNIALYGFCIWAPILIFAALWGIPYLEALYNVDAYTASKAVALIWIGIGIASPLLGWWSDKIYSRKIPLAIASAIGLISSSIIIFVPNLSWNVMLILLLGIGIAAGGQSLSFAVVKEINKSEYLGTACGLQNMMVIAGGGLLFQPLAGYLLDSYWDNTLLNGIPLYSATAYEKAFIIIPGCFLIALIVSLCMRETHIKEK